MSVDQYSVCPCGSGKKIKFCKCKESIHEMDRVLKMFSGGQMVAALDRLNQILDEHPDAAWCLAIKGRLLLELKEDEALAENAERFIRLQPSNPLALTQQAASRGMRGESMAAAESLLQALAESGSGVDPFVLDVASVLALSFAQEGILLSSRCFGGLALSASGYENRNLAEMAIEQVNRARDVSCLLKEVPELSSPPKDPAVRERYNEAASLLKANQILLAESKFESVARSFPGEESALRGQLVCSIWRGDAERQSELLKKLSEIGSIDFQKRAHDLALSALVRPEQPELSTPVFEFKFETDDLDLVEQELISRGQASQLPAEILRAIGEQTGEEVPPRSAFQLLDREIEDEPTFENDDQIPMVMATAILYGKQTSRSARLELMNVAENNRSAVLEFFGDLAGIAGDPQSEQHSIPMMAAASPELPILKIDSTRAEVANQRKQLIEREFAGRVLHMPLGLFDNKSAGETVDDANYELQRTALVRAIESYDVVYDTPTALDKIRTGLNVDPLPSIELADDEQAFSLPLAALYRVDIEKASSEQLQILMSRARHFRQTPILQKTSARIIEMDLQGDDAPLKLSAYLHSIDATSDYQAATKLLEDAKTWAVDAGVSHAPLLLSEITLRLEGGDGEAFQSCVQEIMRDFRDDPQVMAQLQSILMQLGLINPDGSPRAMPGAAGATAAPPDASASSPASPGGLWTPDSPTPPQPTAGAGAGKLWVPGSD